MKYCPQCNAKYGYDMSFCLEDGTPLQIENTTTPDENAERRIWTPHQDSAPPNKETANINNDTLALPQSHPSSPNKQPEEIIPTPIPVSQPTLVPNEFVNRTDWSNKQTNPQQEPPSVPNQAFLTSSQNDTAPQKSYIGALLGIAAAGLILIVSAIGGILYFQRQPAKDLAIANTANITPNINKPSQNQTVNLESANSNGSRDGGFNLLVNTNKSASNSNEKPTPKPSATTESTPKTTSTPENKPPVEEDTPEPRTPTPLPTKQPTQGGGSKTVSGGVLNGKAAYLVAPVYPPGARAVHASGSVNVQVVIDENGNVISASAVSGHPLLKQSAERAALASKFTPTTVGGQKARVTGVIVYNFNPQ